jgi:hypothetical protein
MTKISQQIKEAFLAGVHAKHSNTTTDGNNVWLYGHKIIKRTADGLIQASWAGYPTATTAERLRNITDADFRRKGGDVLLNNEVINPYDWYAIRFDSNCQDF